MGGISIFLGRSRLFFICFIYFSFLYQILCRVSKVVISVKNTQEDRTNSIPCQAFHQQNTTHIYLVVALHVSPVIMLKVSGPLHFVCFLISPFTYLPTEPGAGKGEFREPSSLFRIETEHTDRH